MDMDDLGGKKTDSSYFFHKAVQGVPVWIRFLRGFATVFENIVIYRLTLFEHTMTELSHKMKKNISEDVLESCLLQIK